MRPQVAVYLHRDTKKWLAAYAKRLDMTQSEVARMLIEREQQIGWLKWALSAPDPAQGNHPQLKRPRNRLPPRLRKPPPG